MNTDNLHRTLSGRVISNKTDKTLTVLIERKNKTSAIWKNHETFKTISRS